VRGPLAQGLNTAVAILPAGTANLLAANLNVPHDLAEAVRVGLHGDRRRLDTGSVNGERFTVMAGAGFDARMISDADRGAKDRLGRAAYVVTGIRNLRARRVRATIKVDGKRFFEGKVSCVLAANVGKILGGVEAFPQARPDDGCLELGIVTARNPVQWARTFGQLALGHPEQSPFAKVTQGRKFRIRFEEKIRFELDGGARPASKKLRIKVRPSSVTVCVPPRPDADDPRLSRGGVKRDHGLDALRPAQDQLRRLLRRVAARDERLDCLGPALPEEFQVPQRGCEVVRPGVHRAQHDLVLQHHVPHRASRVRLGEGLQAGDAGEHEDPVGPQPAQRLQSEMRVPGGFVDQVDVAQLFRQVRECRGLAGYLGRADGGDQVDPRTWRQLA
jgi:diacylglycerol kinase (ATP)